METWTAHHLFSEGQKTLGAAKAASLRAYATQLSNRGLAVVFSLRHLSKITHAEYQMLHDTVNRKREASNYRLYSIKKRSGGRRFIHAVAGDLLRVQQFINEEILQKITAHSSSFAFHPSGGIRRCAMAHCGARWLLQFDLKDFFHDVTEVDVFKIFKDLGYRELLAFELARICTTTNLPADAHGIWDRGSMATKWNEKDAGLAYADRYGPVGVLPQGAPTSPMLSNLAAKNLDEILAQLAVKHGLIYTRYADDLTLSAVALPSGISVGDLHRAIIQGIRRSGFRENKSKTRISRPGSRKMVLGLLVDGDVPRLSRQTFQRIDRHLHAAAKYGLAETATHEGFDSAFGFHNHLSGLISYVKDVDTPRWQQFSKRFEAIPFLGTYHEL